MLIESANPHIVFQSPFPIWNSAHACCVPCVSMCVLHTVCVHTCVSMHRLFVLVSSLSIFVPSGVIKLPFAILKDIGKEKEPIRFGLDIPEPFDKRVRSGLILDLPFMCFNLTQTFATGWTYLSHLII